MVMEMNAKANATDRRQHEQQQASQHTDRRHVRNLWPSVGGGLPGGKPVEPATAGPGHGGQSTSYAQGRPAPKPVDAANVVNVGYYCKSSQVGPVAAAAQPTTAEYAGGHHYGQHRHQQQPVVKSSQRPAVDCGWLPPPLPPPAIPLYTQQMSAQQFYHSDPTTLFNQVRI